MRDDRLYLIHIAECIERIERYTAPGHDAFLSDSLIQDAVLRNLHTLSESTQRLSDGLKDEYPRPKGVPERSVAGMEIGTGSQLSGT